jgi:hypothetical protein
VRPSSLLWPCALLAAGLTLGGLSRAQDPAAEAGPPAGNPVRVEVMVGYISSHPGTIDPRAIELARMLNQEFNNLQTLRVIQMERLSLALRQMGQVPMPTGHWVSVQPEEITPHGVRMGVEVQGIIRTHVNIPSGNQVVIGAYKYEEGRLVVRLVPTYDVPVVTPEGR